MSELSQDNIKQILQTYVEPHLGVDLVTAQAVKTITIAGGAVAVQIELGFPAEKWADALAAELKTLLEADARVEIAQVSVDWKITSHAVQTGLQPMPNVKNIIAVASGKGGVGKSTTTANLALALQAEGASVGVLDADIYGPSQPRMLGVAGKPQSPDGRNMSPMVGHGLQTMSIGYLIDEEQPTIWRGPMVTTALSQLLNETLWQDLDYLIIDLPPGTGDTQLTLAQKIPVSGAVIVTTPQDIALLDARKGLRMFEKVSVPVLGVVENMSIHICSNCGHAEPIFGEGGGANLAAEHGVNLLGALPLDIGIRQEADSGTPTVAADADGPIAELYQQIARKTAARLSLQSQDQAAKFPNIVVENN